MSPVNASGFYLSSLLTQQQRSQEWVQHLHATHDINRLRLHAVARVFHVNNRHREVNVESQLAEVSVAEHFEVRSQEVLQQGEKKNNNNKKNGLNISPSYITNDYTNIWLFRK